MRGRNRLRTIKKSATIELSTNSIVGITNNNAMKVVGKLNREEVIVLIDRGASYKFISSEVVEQLAIPIKTTKAY